MRQKRKVKTMDVKEYRVGNVTIVVSRPILTASEQVKQETKILTALQQYGKGVPVK